MRGSASRLLLVVCAAIASAVACKDPIPSSQKDELGDEDPGYSPGPYHRAGQPCLVCHSERGGETEFTIAGTIFASPTRQVGVDATEIRLTDADGTQFIAKTNCVGNFFVKPSEWTPKFPVLVTVAKNGTRHSMQSAIGRDGSCAHCHSRKIPVEHPERELSHIYLFGGDEPGAPNGALDCPVSPRRPGSPP
jgi:hypothetical protein